MKTGFKDRTAVKKENPPNKLRDKPSNWGLNGIEYDERSSCFINAGTHFGIGRNQPVGHTGNPRSEGVPKGRVHTERVDEKG